MPTAKHTQGLPPAPYSFTPKEVGTLGIIRDVNGQPILDLLAQQEPLGRLFASAPELLEALKQCAEFLDVAFESEGDTFGIQHNAATDALSNARSLLARLEGEQ